MEVVFSSRSSKRSGALRVRDGRELGSSGGAAVGFCAGVFFSFAGFLGADVLGAAAFFVAVLLLAGLFAFLAGLLGGGVPKASSSSSSSSYSSRARFGLCLGARLAPMFDVGADIDSGADMDDSAC